MKSLLAVSDGGPATEPMMRIAGECASRFGAVLDVVHERESSASASVLGMAGQAASFGAVGRIAENQHDAIDAVQAEARAAFDRYAAPSGANWLSTDGEAAVVLPRRARYADLVFLARPALAPNLPEPGYVAHILLETGRPTLLVPGRETSWPPKQAIVAWSESPPATMALAAAVPLLQAAGTVTVLAVGRPGERADTKGVVTYLARHGIAAREDVLDPGAGSARARGRALLAHVDAKGADFLVMGAYGEGRLANFLGLGGATGKVITAAKVPVLVAH